MPNVYPMRPLGAGEDSADLLTYVARDPIGVEDPGALPTDWTSINEGYEWTERVDGGWTPEHDLYGLHHTLKVARGVCHAGYNEGSGLYEVQGDSYLQNAAGGILRGTSAFSASSASPGVVTVDLLGGYVLPSLDARIAAFAAAGNVGTGRVVGPAANPGLNRFQAVRLFNVVSTTQMVIHLRRGDNSGVALAHGNFLFTIHDR